MRLAAAGIGWLLWPIALSLAVAAATWSLRHTAQLALIDTNKLTEPDRISALKFTGATFGGVMAVYLASVIAVRVRAGSFRVVETFSALNKRLRFLLAAPLVAMLRLPNIEKDSPKQTLFFITCAGVTLVWSLYYWVKSPSVEGDDGLNDLPPPPKSALRRALDAAPRFLAPLAVLGLWVGYGLFFSRLSITNHHALNSRIIDLGYYDNIFYQSIHGHPLACSFTRAGWHGSSHFDPILVVLSPLYLIRPGADIILVIQAFWLGAGVVPLYLMGREKGRGRGVSLLIAASYAIYPALHGANMYEFHSLTLIAPIVLWLLYFLEIGATKRYFAVFALLLLTREDTSLLSCFIGLYAILTRRPKQARIGQATILIALTYFAVVKRFVMESSDLLNSGDPEAYSFAYYFDDLIPNKNGVGGLVTSVLTNPSFLVKYTLAEPKVIYLLLIFLPLLFLPFFARTGRVMLVYGITFCLLATRSAVFTIHFQYSCLILAVAFALVPMALQQIEDSYAAAPLGINGRRLAIALAGGMFLTSALVSWKFGGLLPNASFRGGFSGVTRELTDEQKATYAWVVEQAKKIPPAATVAATGRVGAHVSSRRYAYFYPEKRRTDYVFVDENELRGNDLEAHKKSIASGEIVEVGRRGALALFKRK